MYHVSSHSHSYSLSAVFDYHFPTLLVNFHVDCMIYRATYVMLCPAAQLLWPVWTLTTVWLLHMYVATLDSSLSKAKCNVFFVHSMQPVLTAYVANVCHFLWVFNLCFCSFFLDFVFCIICHFFLSLAHLTFLNIVKKSKSSESRSWKEAVMMTCVPQWHNAE